MPNKGEQMVRYGACPPMGCSSYGPYSTTRVMDREAALSFALVEDNRDEKYRIKWIDIEVTNEGLQSR